MKTVVISGYYGFENIGDEALLAAIVAALRAEVPNLRVIVLSAKPEETAARYGVEAVDRFSLGAVFSALKQADLLISGGGSLLQDVTGPLTIPYYLGIVAVAKLLGKPVMFYGQGIGPVNGAIGKWLVKTIGNRVDMITLRDSASAAFLSEIGVNRPPVEVTADPVFGLDIEQLASEASAADIANRATGHPAVGVCVREWQGKKGYKEAIAGLCDNLSENNWQVVFLPMQHPADLAPAREIAGLMNTTPVIIDRALSFNQLAAHINSMDVIVGMRLHALIIAAACAVPMVGISYDPKVSEFLAEIHQPVLEELDSLTAQQLTERFHQAVKDKEKILRELEAARSQLRQKALRNSQLAAKLLDAGK